MPPRNAIRAAHQPRGTLDPLRRPVLQRRSLLRQQQRLPTAHRVDRKTGRSTNPAAGLETGSSTQADQLESAAQAARAVQSAQNDPRVPTAGESR